MTEDYRTTFDITVRGTLFTVQKALPLLREGCCFSSDESSFVDGLELFVDGGITQI